jgi:hypothetical protein
MDMAMNDAAPPRAAMKGATGLLREILDELALRASPQPELRPREAAELKPDPRARAATASLGDLVDRLDQRGFGLLFFLLALPCIPPFVYVLPQIVSVPMLALAAQMAAGREDPWLPETLRKRRFSVDAFRRLLDGSEKYVRFVERFAHPRLRAVTGRRAARLIGGLLTIPAVSILVPMIGTNTAPSIGICVAALGLIERDGVLVILGLLIGVGWVLLLLGLWAFLGVAGLNLIVDWVGAHF